MNLSFPNPSRSFDAGKSRVCFWGYDSAIEISFYVAESALKHLCPQMSNVESGFLQAFDGAQQQIYEAADKVYANGKKGSYAYILEVKDFKV